MAIIKCKMCGGNLEADDTKTYGTCDSCGSTMTLPKSSDERKVNLFNRANHFRRLNEFDKALLAYENILNEDNSDAEAHWGAVLSRYGIEYVEDPISHERIPTCHRTQYASILSDADYLSALDFAPDGYSKSLYEQEAKRIHDIQKEILAISSKEDPFDVFICYKESSESGSRTQDSVLAQDLYYHLTNDGYKVFFSKITLESKLGQQYEPYIFAALNSAKVMVVIGTKPEYFSAVWVKNEWERYLSLVKKDKTKLLIPCYRDMDAYDLPNELSALQSLDMSKIGFIQDLVRGIKKVVVSEKEMPKSSSDNVVPVPVLPSNISPLLKRAFLCLEDGDFKKADDLLEQVLNFDPECSRAYVGKLMIELKIKQTSELANNKELLSSNSNFQKALRFADPASKVLLNGYNQAIIDRLENERKEVIYQQAIKIQKEYVSGRSENTNALSLFWSIAGYKDSDDLAHECEKLKEEKRIAKEIRQETEWVTAEKEHAAGKANQEKWVNYFKKTKSKLKTFSLVCAITIASLFIFFMLLLPAVGFVILFIGLSIESSILLYSAFGKVQNVYEIAKKIQTHILSYRLMTRASLFSLSIFLLIAIFCFNSSSKYFNFDYRPLVSTEYIIQINNDDQIILEYVGYKENVIIPEGITQISPQAFKNKKRIKSITIPSSVTSIGEAAFLGCSGLTSITMPFVGESKTATGSSALFGYVFGSTSYPGGNLAYQYYASSATKTYYLPSALRTVIITDASSLPFGAFSGCFNLTSIIIPSSVTNIGDRAFSDCSSLTSITIPTGVTSINSYVFNGCSSLTSITIPTGVAFIGYNAFFGCSSLTNITIPMGVATILSYVFAGCSSLTSITIPSSVDFIDEAAFSGCRGLTSITLPFVGKSRAALGNEALFGFVFGDTNYSEASATTQQSSNGPLKTFYIPSALRTVIITDGIFLQFGAFSNCTSLTSIAIPSSLRTISSYSFYGCESLTSISIPSSVSSISSYAFSGCEGLTSIAIPLSVTYIGSYAFSNCRNLEIYAEATSKPSEWVYYWNPENRPVIWGFGW